MHPHNEVGQQCNAMQCRLLIDSMFRDGLINGTMANCLIALNSVLTHLNKVNNSEMCVYCWCFTHRWSYIFLKHSIVNEWTSFFSICFSPGAGRGATLACPIKKLPLQSCWLQTESSTVLATQHEISTMTWIPASPNSGSTWRNSRWSCTRLQ